MSAFVWVAQTTGNPRFPYRVAILREGEKQAMRPTLPFIFAGTRKEANIWAWSFFKAVSEG